MMDLKYNPKTELIYRDGVAIGHVKEDKKAGVWRYKEFKFSPTPIDGPDLHGLLTKVRSHEEKANEPEGVPALLHPGEFWTCVREDGCVSRAKCQTAGGCLIVAGQNIE